MTREYRTLVGRQLARKRACWFLRPCEQEYPYVTVSEEARVSRAVVRGVSMRGLALEWLAGKGRAGGGHQRSSPLTLSLGALLLLTATHGRSADGTAGSSLPVLTKIQAIRALSQDESARGYRVRIRGTLTYFDEVNARGMIIHDGRAGQFIAHTPRYFASHPRIDLRLGDLVEVEGHTIRGGFAPNVMPDRVRRLGRAPLPPVRRVPYTALLTGRYDCDYVEIVGGGQRAWLAEPPAQTMFLEVATEGGTVRASFWAFEKQDLTRFIDARVRLRGNVGAIFSQAEQLRGVSLLSGRTSDVVIELPPPTPAQLPTRAISSLYQHLSGDEADRRVRVRGVVTYKRLGQPVTVQDFTAETTFRQVRHVLYIQDATGGVRVETEHDVRVQPGEHVDVVGFPTVTPTKPMLRNAVISRMGDQSAPAPVRLSSDSALAAENDAQLMRADGQLLGLVKGPTEDVLVLQHGARVFDASIDPAEVGPALEGIRPGSTVAVTGVYAFQWGPPPSFRLLLRSAHDVDVLRAAPWWTLGHSIVLATIVAIISLGAALWVRTVVRKNTLIQQQYQTILTERSRLARELHDTLEQGLAGVNLQLEAVSGALDGSAPIARRSLSVAREMLRYCQDEARRSVMDLRSQALESQDLPAALSELAHQMTEGTSISADVQVVGAPRRLPSAREHHLLRIGLEALTNAVKHSGASRIEIELRFDEGVATLVVRDNGVGFRGMSDGAPASHFGLRGIRERVDKMGGKLNVGNRAQGGAEIAVSVPA